ncbi:GNAT family acetyltransferase [Streptococcus pseudoporcinus]|uniref:GNAT family acetyltransferase n=1 Tax=Streptococcus pseudoporcinus TaxID=361101 RepID=A0A4U9YRK5_9STRE|nr:GNAT family N-acetyltransferase [Streptococcus pseudoporcinus]VTS29713.1 GNAT family acetyltransferase [Streptococcus pseudoporcinus]
MIRKTKLEDAKALQKICKEDLGYDSSLKAIEQQIDKLGQDEQHHLFVFEDDCMKEVLGFVEVQVYEAIYSKRGLNILGLAVAHSYQGQGIGKQLMTYIEAWACQNKLTFIRLNSGSHRTEAHAFYQRLDYDGTKRQVRFIKFLQ